MQPPTVREVTKMLESEGYEVVRQAGSHIRYKKESRTVTVAGKPSEHLNQKTWNSIKKQAGW